MQEKSEDSSNDFEINNYAQNFSIHLEDLGTVVSALMKAGYDVVCRQDGESKHIVMLEILHPKYSGHYFREDEI